MGRDRSLPCGPSIRERRVSDSDERCAGRIDSQRARPEADHLEVVRRKEGQLEIVPATFRSNGQKHAPVVTIAQSRTD